MSIRRRITLVMTIGLVAIGGALAFSASAGAHRYDISGLVENQGYSGWVGTITEPCANFFGIYICANPSVTVDWGDGTSDASPTLTLTAPCGTPFSATCTYNVADTHTYADEGVYPTALVWSEYVPLPLGPFTASGAVGGNAFVGDAPLGAGSGPTIGGSEGTVQSATATFTDANTASSAADFSATIDWGDGSTSPGTVSWTGSGYQVQGSHRYDEGSYRITVSVADDGGSTAIMTGTANITDSALAAGSVGVSATEGPYSGQVATFSDPNPIASASDFSATINWGDGSAPTAGTVTGSAGSFRVIGSHTFDEGTFPHMSVSITDDGGATALLTGTATITDAALTGTPSSISAFSTVPYSGVLATFKDANPAATLTNYTATINWGDGTTGTGVVAPAPTGGYQISGTHTFATPGTYAVSIKINDVGGSTVTINDSAAVGSPPVPVTTTTPSPALPNGLNGYYRTPVHVIVTASGLGTAVAQTRCVVDPPAPPADFDALPAGCPFTGVGANVTGDGTHRIYAASVNASGNKEAPELTTLKIDATPPALSCASPPTFVLGSSGGSVTAVVRDATSGPASSTVSAPARLSSPGMHLATLTGYDNAGNAAVARCAYRILGHMNNLMDWGFAPGPRYSTVADLVALSVPIGAKIRIVCSHARGCPFHTESMTVTAGAKCKGKHCSHKVRPHSVNVDLAGMVGKRHLPVGSQLEIVISKPFEIGKVFILTVRANRQPSSRVSCMAPGSSVPGQGC